MYQQAGHSLKSQLHVYLWNMPNACSKFHSSVAFSELFHTVCCPPLWVTFDILKDPLHTEKSPPSMERAARSWPHPQDLHAEQAVQGKLMSIMLYRCSRLSCNLDPHSLRVLDHMENLYNAGFHYANVHAQHMETGIGKSNDVLGWGQWHSPHCPLHSVQNSLHG